VNKCRAPLNIPIIFHTAIIAWLKVADLSQIYLQA